MLESHIKDLGLNFKSSKKALEAELFKDFYRPYTLWLSEAHPHNIVSTFKYIGIPFNMQT